MEEICVLGVFAKGAGQLQEWLMERVPETEPTLAAQAFLLDACVHCIDHDLGSVGDSQSHLLHDFRSMNCFECFEQPIIVAPGLAAQGRAASRESLRVVIVGDHVNPGKQSKEVEALKSDQAKRKTKDQGIFQFVVLQVASMKKTSWHRSTLSLLDCMVQNKFSTVTEIPGPALGRATDSQSASGQLSFPNPNFSSSSLECP